MSIWTDRIQTHSIWSQLETLGSVVDLAFGREEINPSTYEGLNRIKSIVAFIGQRLAGTDSLLVLPSTLDSLGSHLAGVIVEIQNFVANGNEGHVTNANSNLDGGLTYLAQIVAPTTPEDLKGLRAGTDAYRSSLESNLRKAQESVTTYRSDLATLQEKISALATEVSSEKQRLTTLASEYQSQFSSAQETRSKDYLEAQTSRQEKFADLLSDYAQKHSDQTADYKRMHEALEQKQKESLSLLNRSYQDAASELLEKIQDHLKQVEKLVGVIGNLGVTSGYQKASKEARMMAWVWQAIVLLSLGSVIGVAYKAFIPLIQGTFTWSGFAGRAFVSLTVGLLAAYAISQADKYQQVERRSRKLALELEALGPFVQPLESAQQEQFRLKIGERSFGVSNDLIDIHSADSPKSILDVAKSKDLTDFVVSVIKAVKGG